MALSSRLALWEQKIKEEDKPPPPPVPPPPLSVVPGGFIKQLVRETEKEAKKKEPEIKEEKPPSKLSDNLVLPFLLPAKENTLPEAEMASQAALLVNGLHGETEGKGRPAANARKPSRRLMSPEPGGTVSHSATNGIAQKQELGPHKQEKEVAIETKPEDSRSRSRHEDPLAGKTEKREEEERGEESEENERERNCVKNATEEQVEVERDGTAEGRLESEQKDMWYEAGKVWYVQKDGFSLATELKPDEGTPDLPEGTARIRLDSDGTVVEVEEEKIERTNPPGLELAEDLSQLVSVNESSVLHTLQSRYQAQLHHTLAGRNLLSVRPDAAAGKTGRGKKTGAVPPLIQTLAQRAYRSMVMERRDQTIVPLGRSGAGKTTSCHSVLEQLVSKAGSVDSTVTVEKIQAIFTVLQSFGSVTTQHSSGSTRFSMVLALDFSHAGKVAAAHLQTMLLERTRVCQHPEDESSFNVFAQMLAGLSTDLRTELHLHQMSESSSFGILPPTKTEEKQKASVAFGRLVAAMETLGFTANEQRAIWHVLAGIYHLGAAGVCKVGRKQFLRFQCAQNAASVLGCEGEELSTGVFKHHLKHILQQATRGAASRHSTERGDSTDGTQRESPKLSGAECVEGMAVGLYEELFTMVVSLINRSVSSKQLSLASIMVVDTPGFLNPRHGNKERAGTFEELCHNYVHERLQAFYHEGTFSTPLQRYRQENVPVQFEEPESSPAKVVSVIDQTSLQVKGPVAGQGDEPRGLLWVLDEEVLTPGSSEAVVLERLCNYYQRQPSDDETPSAVRQCEQPLQCEISHQLGRDPVRYDLSGWFSRAKPNLSALNAGQILQESSLPMVRSLFAPRSKVMPVCRSVGGLEGSSQQVMQRTGCVRKTFSSGLASVRRRSPCALVKLQADALINLIKRSRTLYLHCLLPRLELDGVDWKGPPVLEVAVMRTQLHTVQLLQAVQLYRTGYPDHMALSDFRHRFQALAPPIMKKYGSVFMRTDERKAVQELLTELDLDKKSFAVGLSQVFLKHGVLSSLELQREKLVTHILVLLQAASRGHLSRQHYRRMKVQELAVRCIQKNLRKLAGVRDWSWWRLLCGVRPLLDINIDDHKFRAKEDEITELRRRLEKSERDRNELRQSADALETKVTDLSSELSDERFKGEAVCQVLDSERAERLRLNWEVKELQSKYDVARKSLESVERKLEEAMQQLQTYELERGITPGTGDEWQLRYDCAQTEMEFLRKRLRQMEEKMESELQDRKELELKLTDLQGKYDETKRSALQLKRKCRRVTFDLQDTRVQMERQQGQNHDLEKKQRRFDTELARALGEASLERDLREKVSQENNSIRSEIFKLQRSIQEGQSELALLHQQKEELDTQLQDLATPQTLHPDSAATLKKQLRELEARVKELTAELTKQADTIQQHEQTRLRFEMEMERMKQIHQKELEDKEEELEDVQKSSQRRLRQLEMQLEQEYEEKQLVLHEKLDLEGLIATLCEQIGHRDFDVEKRLRRDLRRTHTLLADAQLILGTLEDPVSNGISKEEAERLQSQLAESETRYVQAEKMHKTLMMELDSAQLELENICRNKSLVDEQLFQLQHEKADLLKRIEEDQEDLNELMKKHKALIAQSSSDISQIRELQAELEEAKKERQSLQEKLQASLSRVSFMEGSMVERSIVSRQEALIRDLENKLEFQSGQIKRFEVLVLRLRDSVVRMGEELEHAAETEAREKEHAQYYQQRLQEMRVEMEDLARSELESSRRRVELEMRVEELSAVRQTLQADLETSIKRIADLQTALEEESSDESDSESVQTAVDSFGRKRDLDSQSTVGSMVSADPEEGIRSWLGVPRGPGSPYGSSAAGSVARQPASDTMSMYSVRSLPRDSEGSRPGSSLSVLSLRRRELGQDQDSQSQSSVGEGARRRVTSPLAESTSSTGSTETEERERAPSSLALSEFLEELRRKRGSERADHGSGVGREGGGTLPIYQTTGASVLRRRGSSMHEQEDVKSVGSEMSFRPTFFRHTSEPQDASQTAASSALSPRMARSASLRSLPESTGDRRMTRFSSCEALSPSPGTPRRTLPILEAAAEEAESSWPLSRVLKPIRKRLGLSIAVEEDGEEVQLGKEPLVFRNRRLSNLTDEDKTVESKGDDMEPEILPAIRRAQSTSSLARNGVEHKEGRRTLSVHFGELPSPKTVAHRGGSDSESDSEGSTVSLHSIESAGARRARPSRAQGELGEEEMQQQEAEGHERDVSSVMRKYLCKKDS
ncbi:unconventional myosin-XVIIIb-like isoform X2 [Polyodon spathula]|uniref:unconventional myosin-XVIIIb-like isoform X2 n=1 Tax=Polyodon spathula TaxID=7913 RepID=UPI001B7DFB03|nr:unconventional myosin-XVIIIb-like isoform X2 [Polyodon spathula]